MKGPQALLDAENNLVTDMGAWFPGERVVFRGKDLHHDLGDMSWMELYLYGITGRRFTSAQMRIFNAIWVLTSYPDPRLWNNRVVGLAASARSTGVLGISAGIGVSEALIYGARPEIRAHVFLTAAGVARAGGDNMERFVLSALENFRGLPGYGRPVVKTDERLEPFLKCLCEAGARNGEHIKLAFEIGDILSRLKYRYHLNYAGATAAVAADLGLSSFEYYSYCTLAFVGGMVPVFDDQSKNQEGSFFPIRCSDIQAETSFENREWSVAKKLN